MLVELRLENYAVIDNVAVEFAPGLNLLTGETGAGKSILIDALALLLGDKASSDVIRTGADKPSSPPSSKSKARRRCRRKILETNGIDADDGSIILRREIAAGGKGRVFVNNQPATVAVLRQLAPHLAIIHAQNESMLSFDAAARLALLDSFRRQPTRSRLPQRSAAGSSSDVASTTWSTTSRTACGCSTCGPSRSENRGREAAARRRRATRNAEKRVLANAEKIYNAAMNAFDLLYEGNASTAASLRAAQKHDRRTCPAIEPKFHEALSAIESARISVEDVGATLRDYGEGIEASPERLAEVEDRLAAARSPEAQVWSDAART